MRICLSSPGARLISLLVTGLLAAVVGSAPAQVFSPLEKLEPSPTQISLSEAIRRAIANEPNFAATKAEQRAASLDRGIARAALLPGAVYHNQVLYTQPNGASNSAGPKGSQPAPIFIANNAVREYASQAAISETVGLAQVANVRVADAAAMRAAAELEIARRGLVVATSSLYFSLLASERKLLVLESATQEASNFVALTQKREAVREVAHADVIKAELTLQQRTRDRADAILARDRAQLELAMLLFADPLTPFTLDPAAPSQTLPALSDVQAAASHHNPELASALAALQQSEAEVLGARAAYLPGLGLNFTYGIDGTTFATKAPFDSDAGRNPRNLGYSIAATLDIPVWDWFSTEHRVKQSEVRREAVRVALTAAQTRLIVDLKETYTEAQTAQNQLASLSQTSRSASESLRLTRLRYSSGEATALEVVDAQTTLYAAQTALEDGLLRNEQALTSLHSLMGTL
jgi:outer membrane protein